MDDSLIMLRIGALLSAGYQLPQQKRNVLVIGRRCIISVLCDGDKGYFKAFLWGKGKTCLARLLLLTVGVGGGGVW